MLIPVCVRVARARACSLHVFLYLGIASNLNSGRDDEELLAIVAVAAVRGDCNGGVLVDAARM